MATRFAGWNLLVGPYCHGWIPSERFQRVAKLITVALWRSVVAGDGELVLVTLYLAGIHRTRFKADTNFNTLLSYFSNPQINRADLGVATDHGSVKRPFTDRRARARDVDQV